jgi:hypothetical protein
VGDGENDFEIKEFETNLVIELDDLKYIDIILCVWKGRNF